MPLFILGLLLLTGILAYSIVRYISSGEEDHRPVRERYPHAFPVHKDDDSSADDNKDHDEPPVDSDSYYDEDSLRGDIDYMIRNLTEDLRKKARNINLDIDSIMKKTGRSSRPDENEDNTVEFPKDNIENEKRKRGINSD